MVKAGGWAALSNIIMSVNLPCNALTVDVTPEYDIMSARSASDSFTIQLNDRRSHAPPQGPDELEPFPNQRRKYTQRRKSDRFIQSNGFDVRASNRQAHRVTTQLCQPYQRLADQFIAQARAAHSRQNAQLRDMSRGIRDQARQANAAYLSRSRIHRGQRCLG